MSLLIKFLDIVIFRNFHQNIENLKLGDSSAFIGKIHFHLLKSSHLITPMNHSTEVVVIGTRRWLHLLRISWRRFVINSGGDEVRRFALKEAKQSKDGGTRKLNPSNLKLRFKVMLSLISNLNWKAKEETMSVVQHLHGVEHDEEFVLKRCWLACYWGLAAKYESCFMYYCRMYI
uniref:Uncharacterized protein n=1 Tax=Cucumis melo TaxID=3656 RepID=A0A9I9E8B9_CUCME